MKAKKILILYLNNGDMKNFIEQEAMWKEIMKEYSHLEQKKAILLPNMKFVEFEDGTIIEALPFLENVRAKKLTHIFIAKSLSEYIPVIYGMLIQKGNENFDTEGKSIKERLMFFSQSENKLIIEPYTS